MPQIPDYIDNEVSDLANFGSYQQKDLDKQITWGVDERISVSLLAAIGASVLNQNTGSSQSYVISR